MKKKEDESKAREDEMRALLSKVTTYTLENFVPKDKSRTNFICNWPIHGQMKIVNTLQENDYVHMQQLQLLIFSCL